MSEFNPSMLVVAREAASLTQGDLASRVGISQAALSKIEAGLSAVAAQTIERMAHELGVCAEFFHRSDVERPLPISFYRKSKGVGARDIRCLQANFNMVKMELSRLLRSVELRADHQCPRIALGEFDEDVTEAARVVRSAWRLPPGPVESVVNALEDAGIIVVLLSTMPHDVAAMSTPGLDGAPDMILINTSLPPDRQRFTLAHELGHLVCHTRIPSDDMEREADQFAAEFLMPAEAIRPELVRAMPLKLDRLGALKQRWRVSMWALMTRARDLRVIGPEQYKYLCMEMSRLGYRRVEPIALREEQPSALADILRSHRSDLGYTDSDIGALLQLRGSLLEARYGRYGVRGGTDAGKGGGLRIVPSN